MFHLMADLLLLARSDVAPIPTSVDIAPGVTMPVMNLGGVHSHPSNYSAWIALGGTGIDTALMYGDDVQVDVGDAVQASGLARSDLFITSKVPCCPAALTKCMLQGFEPWLSDSTRILRKVTF